MKNEIKKLVIFAVIIVLLIVFLGITIKIMEDNRALNKFIYGKKQSVQSEIQTIIDQTKENVQSLEQRDAQLSDIKDKFEELGYIIDETNGEMLYKDYVVIIDNNLNISEVNPIETNAWYEISSKDSDGTYTVLIIVENKKGIESIESDDLTLNTEGKTYIALDKKCKEGDVFQFKIKVKGESKQESYTMVATTKPKIVVENMDKYNDGTTKTIRIEYPDNENLINYYSLDKGNTWQIYNGEIDVPVSDDTYVIAKSEFNKGKTMHNYNNYMVGGVTKNHGILGEIERINENGIIDITENGITYSARVYYFEGDQTWTEDKVFGTQEDIATSTTEAKNTIIVKVKGNLNIESGVTVTTYSTKYGGPKGLILYCTGTLTNNGTISMTGKGAKATGENVYLYKNSLIIEGNKGIFDELNHNLNEYEYIPATGANGGDEIDFKFLNGTYNGNNGYNGTKRQTGGGGTGSGRSWNNRKVIIGKGGKGTSYSGGAGSGAANSDGSGGENAISLEPSSIGGAGSNGIVNSGNQSGYGQISIGGTGNPSGNYATYRITPASYEEKNGTGGLLVIYSKTINNNGTIQADGISSSNASKLQTAYGRIDTGRSLRRRKCKYILYNVYK